MTTISCQNDHTFVNLRQRQAPLLQHCQLIRYVPRLAASNGMHTSKDSPTLIFFTVSHSSWQDWKQRLVVRLCELNFQKALCCVALDSILLANRDNYRVLKIWKPIIRCAWMTCTVFLLEYLGARMIGPYT